MKKGRKKLLFLVVGVIFAFVVLFWGWRLYAKNAGPSEAQFQKYLPVKILSLDRKEVTKRPDTNDRLVETAKGKESIMLSAGYSAFYVSPPKLPFLRIHPEQSPKESFEQDKLTIEKQYDFLLSKSSDNKNFVFDKKTYKDHEYYLLGDPESAGGTKQSATLFFPEDSVLVTIYFFNQGTDPKNWDYQNVQEYIELRDKFINQYIDSVLGNN